VDYLTTYGIFKRRQDTLYVDYPQTWTAANKRILYTTLCTTCAIRSHVINIYTSK